MLNRLFSIVVLTFLLNACSAITVTMPQIKIKELARMLNGLDGNIHKHESDKLSQDIFQKTRILATKFKLTSPPLWHNTLVNVGLREKGLCYHWSDALYQYLLAQKYTHFEFHLVGANIGEYFWEHNALVIVKKGEETIENGIIIDPWRNSGKLYFSKMKEDKAYQWKWRKTRECFSGVPFIR